jgi:hypothetical protein
MDVLKSGDRSSQLRMQAILGGIAAVLGIFSVLIGYTQILTGKEKTRWLINRFWTERLRQLHFQLIVNHLPQVVAASESDAGLQQWLAFRASQLDRFRHDYLRGVDDSDHSLELDEAEESPWLVPEWAVPGPIPEPSEHFAAILTLLEGQRFVIQQRYTERKLRRGWHSPQSQAEWVQKLSDAFTALLLLATISAGLGAIVALVIAQNADLHAIAGLVAAVASASVVAMRAMKEGLLVSADAERYRWYIAAVRTLHRRFERAEFPKKVFLLREMEQVAYQEMRRFMLSATRARFIM